MDQVEPFDSYQHFDPKEYLDAYYSPLGYEADGLLRFLTSLFAHEHARRGPNGQPRLAVLEFGSGPTVVGMLCAAPFATVLDVCDYVPANRSYVDRWLAGESVGFDWTPYVERTLSYERGASPTPDAVAERKALVRSLVRHVLPCDIYEAPPVATGRRYDVIISNYCLDAVTADKEEWHRHIKNLSALLKPNGTLMLSSLLGAEYSEFGETRFPNVLLGQDDVRSGLEASSFDPATIYIATAPADHGAREYSGVIFSSARRAPNRAKADRYKRLEVDGVFYYGKHLIISAAGCNKRLLEVETMRDFLKSLVTQIDMVAYGEPVVARFGRGIEVGISGVQLIETSAITIHTNDLARDLYLDVFSCKGFDETRVMDYVREVFSPKSTNHQTLLRR